MELFENGTLENGTLWKNKHYDKWNTWKMEHVKNGTHGNFNTLMVMIMEHFENESWRQMQKMTIVTLGNWGQYFIHNPHMKPEVPLDWQTNTKSYQTYDNLWLNIGITLQKKIYTLLKTTNTKSIWSVAQQWTNYQTVRLQTKKRRDKKSTNLGMKSFKYLTAAYKLRLCLAGKLSGSFMAQRKVQMSLPPVMRH